LKIRKITDNAEIFLLLKSEKLHKMKYLQIDSQLFINNRKKFSSKLKKNTLAIFNSNDIMPTNADGTMPFKQNNDLFWLSGVDQEESVLVIFP